MTLRKIMDMETIDLRCLHNQPIIAKSLEVKRNKDNFLYVREVYLEVKLGKGKLRKKFRKVKKLKIYFRVLNNRVPCQMEFGEVVKDRFVRYINGGQVKIYAPRFKEIKNSAMVISCNDVFVDDLDMMELQEHPDRFW